MRQKLTITGDSFSIADIKEGKDLIAVEIEGEFDFVQEDLDQYVRVSFANDGIFAGSSATYCYRDPGLDLQVGDIVDVPTRYEDSNIAKVVGLGRGAWKRECSDVSAVYERREP